MGLLEECKDNAPDLQRPYPNPIVDCRIGVLYEGMLRVLIKGSSSSEGLTAYIESNSVSLIDTSWQRKRTKDETLPWTFHVCQQITSSPWALLHGCWALEQRWEEYTVGSRSLLHRNSQNLTLKKWLLGLKSLIQWWRDSENSSHLTSVATQGALVALSRNIKDKYLSDSYYRNKQKNPCNPLS